VCGIVAAANRPNCRDELAQLCLEKELPFTVQPTSSDVAYQDFLAFVRERRPDILLVNSYSMILRPDLLELAELGGINMHGALLPEYRGCNPLQWAILNRESVTGVTLHEISAGIDEGAIIDRRVVPLLFEDTWITAQHRILVAAEEMLAENMPKILSGTWVSWPQDERAARYHRRRTADDGLFTWERPVREIYDLVRALVSPHPGARFFTEHEQLQVLDRYFTPAELTAMKLRHHDRLSGPRVVFRAPDAGDGDLLRQWLGAHGETPNRILSFEQILTLERERVVVDLAGQTDLVLFVLHDAVSSQTIGIGAVKNIDWVQSSAELQLLFTESDYPDYDQAHDAVHGLVEFCREDLEVNRLYAFMTTGDKTVFDMYASNGFQIEAERRDAVRIQQDHPDAHRLVSVR
jgi:methionyl-tRNA formyltransferase